MSKYEEYFILEEKCKKLEERVKELETELYFCRRNNKIEKHMGDNNGSK